MADIRDFTDLDTRIEAERQRRLSIPGGYHHWRARGDDGPPTDGRGNPREHWCGYCAGWYGVPHDHDVGLCRYAYHPEPGCCACIDCWVIEHRAEVA